MESGERRPGRSRENAASKFSKEVRFGIECEHGSGPAAKRENVWTRSTVCKLAATETRGRRVASYSTKERQERQQQRQVKQAWEGIHGSRREASSSSCGRGLYCIAGSSSDRQKGGRGARLWWKEKGNGPGTPNSSINQSSVMPKLLRLSSHHGGHENRLALCSVISLQPSTKRNERLMGLASLKFSSPTKKLRHGKAPPG
ncbi:hypothetical protein B0H16DRAFT_1702682 [Mycena metata]|uniref:Uncharacterized protein n=1 Tax=Mycena metata TaxID=1033252 RepID=A0AAD7MDZ8_9AGAR|nr:hypothetical protein B0H16DRAFT_1702682 [Mycena metata]